MPYSTFKLYYTAVTPLLTKLSLGAKNMVYSIMEEAQSIVGDAI
jgi:hypothetical protein